MDKYTVDLDQVLNDFEYSELTDQQSKNASERPQNTTPFQPAPTVTKHSINNVFHSLNEYLNSEISSTGDKVQEPSEKLGFDQQKVAKNDNNLVDNSNRADSKIEEASSNVKTTLDVSKNEHESLNIHSFEISGQNERLLKLKSNSIIEEVPEGAQNTFIRERSAVSLERTEQDIAQEENDKSNTVPQDNEKMLPNLLELDEFSSDTQTYNEVHQIMVAKSDADVKKTENNDLSLLDMENIEPKAIPQICTESNIKSEVNNVNIDMRCDNNIEYKADNQLNDKQINFEEKVDFTDMNQCENSVEIVHNFEGSKSKDFLAEKTENSLNMIDENSRDSENVLKNMEHFVIEPSESEYAQGNENLQEENGLYEHEITKTEVEDKNVMENAENSLDEEQSKEITEEMNEEIEKQLSYSSGNTETIHKSDTKTESAEETVTVTTKNEAKQDSVLMESAACIAEKDSENHTLEAESQKIIVGFSTELDLDDNELNKMLEELEIEEEAGFDDSLAVNLKKTEDESDKNQEIQSQEIPNENINSSSLSSDDNVESKEKMDDSMEKETKATSDSLKELSPEKPNENKANIPQPIECLEMEKPNKLKKKSSKSTEALKSTMPNPQVEPILTKEHTETVEKMEEPTQDEEKSIQGQDNKPAVVLEKQHSQDSLSRPQNLPLNNDVKEEGVATRKIDLIGSPGSTPYNNVYINKSIEPKTAHDTDSDYTSSASPTFSDCSTESTSTASTVSVEDFPKNVTGATIVPTKNPVHKSKHSEKSGKNRESGEDVREKGDTGASQENSNVQGEEGAVSLPEENSASTEESASNILESGGGDSQERSSQPTESFLDKSWLGKEAPLWIPDADAATCLHCDMKFTVLKRRHHCRACGLVLCSKCCNLKLKLEYLDAEARVCNKCYDILNKESNNTSESGHNTSESGDSPAFRPNPNNPLEYCSTVSPLQQMGAGGVPPPSVMVPVGVLKRKGSNKKSNKSVMFCDGIAPGSDLTHLDQDFNYQPDTKTQKSPQKVPEAVKKKDEKPPMVPTVKSSRNQPKIDPDTGCFIPKSETSLPPTVSVNKTDILYSECSNSPSVVEMLKNEALVFAINQNLFVNVKIINMSCCINKIAWCFSSDGLINVGSDEIVYLIEYIDEESFVPKDVFFHINNVYLDAVKGTSVKELGLSLHNTFNFLDSKNHAGFVYIRQTFQCLENVLKPKEPFLIGILIHRWETPWAKLFPLRLILRLGAEYRYYPSPLISTRHRDSVFVEIGHTIINLLADFRNFTYTLPQIRGLIIHMEDKKTTITIPKNRYDQVMKSINNSSEHILAFAGNFSSEADSHLVCIQDTQGHENCYTTHAINIHNKPRKVTGASFIVFNGSLKSNSGLTAKSNIVEDGLMIQIPSEHMEKIRDNLRNMKNHTIACGCINATSDETVNIVWGANDVDFNSGVQSPVDLSDMKGVPSIRVHNGKDHFCNNGTRLIRWTEVFILQNGEENPKNQDPVDISKVSESIAKACCTALVKYLDLLVSNSCQKIGIRTTLHVENVSYSAGSNGLKLPPIYMRSLDNELIPVLHRITSNNLGDNAIVLELIFRILNA